VRQAVSLIGIYNRCAKRDRNKLGFETFESRGVLFFAERDHVAAYDRSESGDCALPDCLFRHRGVGTAGASRRRRSARDCRSPRGCSRPTRRRAGPAFCRTGRAYLGARPACCCATRFTGSTRLATRLTGTAFCGDQCTTARCGAAPRRATSAKVCCARARAWPSGFVGGWKARDGDLQDRPGR
jgi:hypothetical protein